MTETFADLHSKILGLVGQFCNRYRMMEYEEMVSMAYEAFVESFGTYDSKKGTFSSHACQKVLSKIYEAQRTFMRRQILGKVCSYDPTLCEDTQSDIRLIDWLDDLSEDARTTANLLLDAPREIMDVMTNSYYNPVTVRKTVKEYLKDCDWGVNRITESFHEIAEALR